ncbi:hypothetical protein LTR17_020988 [Elasticomyces elasticus]|nr:hypothetical protein LTR17_020988 [Elasticomyces elasticus]
MPNLDTIATELRLNIYEHVLRCNSPLRRAISNDRTSDDERDPAAVSTAILCVSRQIYEEALPVFYAVNTISIRHTNFCLATSRTQGSLSYAADLLVHAHMRDNDDADDNVCPNVEYITSCFLRGARQLLRGFVGPMHPRLKMLTIECARTGQGEEWYGEEVLKYLQGARVTYTGATRFEVVLDPTHGHKQPSITFQCTAIAGIMDRLLHHTQSELEMEGLRGKGFEDIGELSTLCLAIIFARNQASLTHDQRSVLEDAELRPEAFSGQPLSPALYKIMTRAFSYLSIHDK